MVTPLLQSWRDVQKLPRKILVDEKDFHDEATLRMPHSKPYNLIKYIIAAAGENPQRAGRNAPSPLDLNQCRALPQMVF